MGKISSFKRFYVVLIIFILIICVIGSTYAYLTSTASGTNDVGTSSSNFNVGLRITPVYSDFSMIPMDDSDVLKAINNSCKDKYNRGSCHVYNINVYGYDSGVSAISGNVNVTVNNIRNLSYMVFEEADNFNNSNCVSIDSKNYCISKDVVHVVSNTDMSLGDNYNVSGLQSKNLLLVFWLTNLDTSQNSFDIGEFSANVTILLGKDGGQISGNINSSLNNEINRLQSEE